MGIRMILGQVLLEFNYGGLFTKACGCQVGLGGNSGIRK